MNHKLKIVLTVAPCPPYINENGKGIDEAVFIDQVFDLVNNYPGALDSATACPSGNVPTISPNEVVILDENTGHIIFKEPTANTSPQAVANFIESMSAATYDPGTGTYKLPGNESLVPVISNSGNQFLGLGFFNLNLNLPEWAWWMVALTSGAAAVGSKRTIPRVGWGGLAVIAAGNAINK